MPAPPDDIAPDTTFVDPPAFVGETVSFRFGGSDNVTAEEELTFECRITPVTPDQPSDPVLEFLPCANPHEVGGIAQSQFSIEVRAVDLAGNVDPEPVRHAFLGGQDLSAPGTVITAAPEAETGSTGATFAFSIDPEQAGATFACALDGKPFEACGSPVEIAGLAAGAHRFEVRATSAAGVADETPVSHEWTIIGLPQTTIQTAPDATTASTSAKFEFNADQNPVTFACALDGTMIDPCASGVAFKELAPGAHRFEVWATNASGLTAESSASHAWTVVGAPETTLATDLTTPTESTSARFEVSADQTGSTFVCTLDGEVLDPCHSPVEFSDLGDGDHRFEVRATNGYGLTDETPASAVWTVVVAPETTPESMSIDPNDSSKATFTFTGSDNSSQPSDLKFECALDGGEFVPCGSSHTVDGLAPGGHTFEVRAINRAGNVDPTPLRYEWTVEATP